MITTGSLLKDWHWVKEGIEVIRKRANAQWLAEDIYCQIKTGNAVLYVNEERNSFAVMRAIEDFHTSDPGVEIMDGFVSASEEGDKLFSELMQLASDKGYKFMEMESVRKGFERKGWDIEKIVYRRRL